MKFSKLSCIAMLTMAAISSCTNDDVLNSSKSEYINSVRVTVEDFISESPATRTAYTVDNTGFHFQWADGDALGIYPVGGDQVKFPISSGDGSASAAFDGGAWKLRSEYQYAAYYPFSDDNYKISETAIPVEYTGQTQDGDGSFTHLGAYDYLAAGATEPDAEGGVNLLMKHLGAFVRLQLTIPEANTLRTVRIASNNAPFVVKGTVDLSAETPAVTSVTTSTYTEIKLENVTVEADETVTIYMMMAPVDLSSSILTFTVAGNGGVSYSQTLNEGKNMEAGKAYNYALTLDKDDSQYVAVDLGLPSGLKWASFNVGATAPEEYGDHFAWGETETKDNYSQNTYAYFHVGGAVDADGFEMDLWDDLGDISGTEYDVAHQKWGGSWRMPTQSEFEELRTSCTWRWGTKNTVYGYKVTGSNGNWIFLPAAGYRIDMNLFQGGSNGLYWSSLPYPYYQSEACYLFFDSNNITPYYRNYRYDGLSVRPVTE